MKPYLEAYIDDELSPERTLDVEGHLGVCKDCRIDAELSRAVSEVTRGAVAEVTPPPEFQTRLCLCLAAERKREEQRDRRSAPLSWRVIVPLAAAAGLALVLGVRYGAVPGAAGGGFLDGPRTLGGGWTEASLVDTLLSHHARPEKPSVTATESLSAMEPELGFPVRPPNLERYGARFVGANLVSVHDTHVASLHYSLAGGRRVTFYMYDPETLPLRAVRQLEPRVIGDKAVFVGQRRGYSVATCERSGIGYAVTADLRAEESAAMVAAAQPH